MWGDQRDDTKMSPGKPDVSDRLTLLSEREQQVAALLCKGFSNKMIARSLNISEGTIKAHLHAIYTKLRIQSRYELLVALGRDNARGRAQ